MEHLARLAGNLGCRIIFHSRKGTGELISQYTQTRHPEVRAEYEEMLHWKELTTMARAVKEDHLLVVITARSGTVSYKPAFEHLPQELTDSFPHGSMIILYPDQYGQPQDAMTFTSPQIQDKESAYATVLNFLMKFKK